WKDPFSPLRGHIGVYADAGEAGEGVLQKAEKRFGDPSGPPNRFLYRDRAIGRVKSRFPSEICRPRPTSFFKRKWTKFLDLNAQLGSKEPNARQWREAARRVKSPTDNRSWPLGQAGPAPKPSRRKNLERHHPGRRSRVPDFLPQSPLRSPLFAAASAGMIS
ncbi:MAG: hypothetical protein RL145_1805, partial [Pseudomonadota bacterium]